MTLLRSWKVQVMAPASMSDGELDALCQELDGLNETIENLVKNVAKRINDLLTVEVKE